MTNSWVSLDHMDLEIGRSEIAHGPLIQQTKKLGACIPREEENWKNLLSTPLQVNIYSSRNPLSSSSWLAKIDCKADLSERLLNKRMAHAT